jgi:hypothetical protein
LIGTIGSLVAGFADFPVELAKGLTKVATDNPLHGDTAISRSKSPAPSTTSTLKSPTQATETPPSSQSRTQSVTSLSNVVQSPTSDAPAKEDKDTEADMSRLPTLDHHPSTQSVESLGGHRKSLKEHFGRSSPKNPSTPRSGSPARHNSHHKHSSQILRNFDVAMDTGKGVSKIVGVGLKSPLDFTLSLAQGFHNAPKLYGDESVREPEKITGLQSGLKAAATVCRAPSSFIVSTNQHRNLDMVSTMEFQV